MENKWVQYVNTKRVNVHKNKMLYRKKNSVKKGNVSFYVYLRIVHHQSKELILIIYVITSLLLHPICFLQYLTSIMSNLESNTYFHGPRESLSQPVLLVHVCPLVSSAYKEKAIIHQSIYLNLWCPVPSQEILPRGWPNISSLLCSGTPSQQIQSLIC